MLATTKIVEYQNHWCTRSVHNGATGKLTHGAVIRGSHHRRRCGGCDASPHAAERGDGAGDDDDGDGRDGVDRAGATARHTRGCTTGGRGRSAAASAAFTVIRRAQGPFAFGDHRWRLGRELGCSRLLAMTKTAFSSSGTFV